MTTERVDVLVVGGGMGGLSLALLLLQQGVRPLEQALRRVRCRCAATKTLTPALV